MGAWKLTERLQRYIDEEEGESLLTSNVRVLLTSNE